MFCENVGFEENYVTYAKYKEYMHKYKINSLVETENMIEKQRMIKDEEEIEAALKTGVVTDKKGAAGVQEYAEYIAQAVKEGISAGIKGVQELLDINRKVDKDIPRKKYHNIKKVMEKTNKAEGEVESVPQRAVETNKAEAAALATKKEEGSTEKFATLGQFMKKGGE